MAGAEPWQDICEMVGSPELNTAISSFDVGPIDPASFEQMWQHCVSECDEQSRIRIQSRKWSALDVFRCAGGWPFFGKVIGHQLLTLELSDADIDELLRPHFDVMWRRLGRSREILVAAENGQAEATTSVRALSRRGLLMEGVDGGFVPCGLAWSRYIREHSADAADLESEREVLNRRRAELLAELDEVKRIVYADDMLRQSLAREFALLAGWAKDCTDVAVIKSAANALSTSRGREAVVVTELCSHLSLQNVVD